jgi:hypothetical protein
VSYVPMCFKKKTSNRPCYFLLVTLISFCIKKGFKKAQNFFKPFFI